MLNSRLALIAAVAGLIASFGAAAGKASAAGVNQYAGPGSTKSTGACTDQSDPCTIDYAASSAGGGDTIIALPGVHTHGVAANTSINIGGGVTLRSLPGAARATIQQTAPYLNACNCPTVSAYAGAVIDDIRIVNQSSVGAGALGMARNASVTNSILEGVGGGAYSFPSVGGTGVFRGNVVRAYGLNASGFYVGSGGAIDVSQSTIWATGAALRMDSWPSTTLIAVHNSIIHGGTTDISIFAPSNQQLDATFDHSSVDLASAVINGTNGHVLDGGANHDESPQLADPANGDFHPLAGSTTIDNGAAPFSGSDLDGNVFGADGAVDIGAYEFISPAVVSPVVTPPPSGGNPVIKALAGIKLKVGAKRKQGKLAATITCPKTAVGSCSGSLAVKQGKKTKTTKFSALQPGKTKLLKIKAKKGKTSLKLTARDGAGATGNAHRLQEAEVSARETP